MTGMQIVQGHSLVEQRQRVQADGITPSTDYLPTDVLTARVWSGADSAIVATPAAYWTNAATASFSVAFAPSDTAGLDPDIYSIQVVCTPGYRLSSSTRGSKSLRPRGRPPPVYISYAMMRAVVPDVVNLLGDRDETGFADQRAEARLWLDEAVHRHNDGSANLQSDLGALAYAYRWPGKSPIMIGWLAADYLVMSQPLVRAQIYHTLSLIFEGRMLSNPKLYGQLAHDYAVKADNTLRGATAQVMSGGSLRWYPGFGGCYDGTLLTIIDFSATIRLRG